MDEHAPLSAPERRYYNRDISWLAYDSLVLESSLGALVSLRSALNFVAFHSSNLDEFYSVRGAEYRKAAREGGSVEEVDDANALLRQINEIVSRQMRQATHILKTHIAGRLRQEGVELHFGPQFADARQAEWVVSYFHREVVPNIQPVLLGKGTMVFLRDNQPYLAVKLHPRSSPQSVDYSLLKIPVRELPRFVVLPDIGDAQRHVAFLDDVIRFNLQTLYPGFFVDGAWSIKTSRDADLGISDDFEGDIAEEIRDSLVVRKTGIPAVFYHDELTPPDLMRCLTTNFHFDDSEMVACGPYLNLSSLLSMPLSDNTERRRRPSGQTVPRRLQLAASIFDEVANGDFLLHFPYQPFDYVIRLINEAARDPQVEEIKITQYRVATNSAVVESLVSAAKANKRVTVFVELKARFDERNNLVLSDRMKAAGIRIIYSIPGFKVHAKVALIVRRPSAAGVRAVAYVSTGNFNEQTARTYTDHGLFTADEDICTDLAALFTYLETLSWPEFRQRALDEPPAMRKLLVTQINMRETLLRLIGEETQLARQGKPARIVLKMNGLQYRPLIEALYEASLAGVRVDVVVRSICCLAPECDFSRNIHLRRIIDVYLEHGRLWAFGPEGDRGVYLTSSDWLNRNFNRRIEVATPIENSALRRELIQILDLQLRDNTASWVIGHGLRDRKLSPSSGEASVWAQRDIAKLVASWNENDND